MLRRRLLTATVVTAVFMVALDGTIANVALPHIQGSVSASQDQIVWVLTSYLVACAIATPLTGWLTRRFGEKLVYLCATAGFVISSVFCGLAQGLMELVAFRLVQGACGCLLIPLSQTTLLRIYPRNRYGWAMGVFSVGSLMGPILGPAIGGYLTENFSWRWVFWSICRSGFWSTSECWRFWSRQERAQAGFDYCGFIALAVSLGALQLMVDRGQLNAWFESLETWIEAGLVVLGGYCFLALNVTSRQPFLNLGAFREIGFTVATIYNMLMGASLMSVLALMPPMLDGLFGYPAWLTGVVTMPRGLGTIITTLLFAGISVRIGLRLTVFIGWAMIALAQWWMSHFVLDMSPAPVVVSGFLQGLGTGMVFSNLATAAFTALPAKYQTDGASIYNLARNVGSSVGISLMSALQVNNSTRVHSSLVSTMQPGAQPGMYDLVNPDGIQMVDTAIHRAASMAAYATDFKLMSILCFATLPMLVLMKEPKRTLQLEKAAGLVQD